MYNFTTKSFFSFCKYVRNCEYVIPLYFFCPHFVFEFWFALFTLPSVILLSLYNIFISQLMGDQKIWHNISSAELLSMWSSRFLINCSWTIVDCFFVFLLLFLTWWMVLHASLCLTRFNISHQLFGSLLSLNVLLTQHLERVQSQFTSNAEAQVLCIHLERCL